MRRSMTLITAAGMTLGVLATAGIPAFAEGEPPPAEPAPAPVAAATTTVTLPLLGVPLTVDVTTDAGGGLLDVSLGSPDDFIATGLRPNKVSFSNDAAGTSVRISAKHGGQRYEARGSVLADILGAGGWSGDLFETGDVTAVSFVVADRGDGTPDITSVAVTPGVELESVIGDVSYGSGDDDHDDDGHESSAKVRIEFSYLGQTRTMTIKAEVETPDPTESDDDDTPSAKLKISLSGIKGRQIADGPAVGPHTWSGQICAGPATITYTVNEDGSISDVVADPAAEVSADGQRASVTFSRSERVSIKVSGEPGTFEVTVSKKVRCDRVEPGVNTEIAPDATDDHRGDDHGDDDGDHDGDHGDDDGDHDGDHGDDHGDDDGDHDGDHGDHGDRGDKNGGSQDDQQGGRRGDHDD